MARQSASGALGAYMGHGIDGDAVARCARTGHRRRRVRFTPGPAPIAYTTCDLCGGDLGVVGNGRADRSGRAAMVPVSPHR
jgi:hypothetical protein